MRKRFKHSSQMKGSWSRSEGIIGGPPERSIAPFYQLIRGSAITIFAVLLTFPAFAHGRHHARHHRHHHYSPEVSRSFAVAGGLVTVSTAAGIQITVASDFAPKIVGFVRDLVDQGNKPRQIHCYARGGHVAHSLHYSGHACDIDQRGWGKTVAFMYHVRALAQKWGLRDGCSFTDCGHIDAGFRVARVHRSKVRSASAYTPRHGDWGQF